MTRQPRITPSQVDVATAERLSLKNGIDLYTLPSDDFEVLRISFVFRAGSAAQQVPFSASAAANLLADTSFKNSLFVSKHLHVTYTESVE